MRKRLDPMRKLFSTIVILTDLGVGAALILAPGWTVETALLFVAALGLTWITAYLDFEKVRTATQIFAEALAWIFAICVALVESLVDAERDIINLIVETIA